MSKAGTKMVFTTISILITLLLVSGCQSIASTRIYNTPKLVKQYSSVEVDEYKGGKIINGPKQYMDTMSNSGTYFMIRDLVTRDNETIQLYVQILLNDWAFFNSAYWENGNKATFIEIDSTTGSGMSGSYVLETFGVEIPESLLKKKYDSAQDLKVMIYGKRANREIVIQNAYIKGFYDYMTENK
ncbi:hypothetical protein QX776_09830 [Alteromonadaceae bacterium BrNp21-10]|nr:hypothetical protein [Alteromonadaceae bacterium BrNp21-10]